MGILKGYVSEPCSYGPVCSLPVPKANILIDQGGHACLADFSLLTIVTDQSAIISSCPEGGTIPWMSPELLDPESFGMKKSYSTKESDCYALGMVIYEVLSGQKPYAPSKAFVIIPKVLGGERPARPQGEEGKLFTDAIWGVLEHCWKPQPSDRKSAKAVLPCLEGTPLPLQPSSSNVDRDLEADGDYQSDATSSDSSTFFSISSKVLGSLPIISTTW